MAGAQPAAFTFSRRLEVLRISLMQVAYNIPRETAPRSWGGWIEGSANCAPSVSGWAGCDGGAFCGSLGCWVGACGLLISPTKVEHARLRNCTCNRKMGLLWSKYGLSQLATDERKVKWCFEWSQMLCTQTHAIPSSISPIRNSNDQLVISHWHKQKKCEGVTCESR